MGGFDDFLRDNPEEAMKLLARLKGKIVVPHPGQIPVVQSSARYKVLNCGRRWGKTVIGAKLLIDATLAAPAGGVTWWVAPTYKIVKRGYREVLRQLPPDLLAHTPPPDTHFDAGRSVILKFKNGTQMEFYSAERPEGMLGEGVHYVVLDEAARMKSAVWNQIVFPTLMDHKGGALMISTPRGRDWFYKVWQRGQDPEAPLWESWTMPTSSNPHIGAAEIQEMKNSIPTVLFEQEVEAKFIAAGSSVFEWPDGNVQHSRILDNGMVEGVSPKGAQVFLGIDLAKTQDYTVLYGAVDGSRHNVYFERFNSVKWSEQKRRIRRAVGKLMAAGADSVTLMMDSTGLGDPIVEELADNGFEVEAINFTTHKTNMVIQLAKDLETGHAFLLSHERARLTEFEAYQMGQSEKTKKITYSAPEGEHDDVVSAKMLSHWGMATMGLPAEHVDTDVPWEVPDDAEVVEVLNPEDDFSDLIDMSPEEEQAAMQAIGATADRPLTLQERMADPLMWN